MKFKSARLAVRKNKVEENESRNKLELARMTRTCERTKTHVCLSYLQSQCPRRPIREVGFFITELHVHCPRAQRRGKELQDQCYGSTPVCGMFPFVTSLISLSNVLQFSLCKSFTSLTKLIPKYFILF